MFYLLLLSLEFSVFSLYFITLFLSVSFLFRFFSFFRLTSNSYIASVIRFLHLMWSLTGTNTALPMPRTNLRSMNSHAYKWWIVILSLKKVSVSRKWLTGTDTARPLPLGRQLVARRVSRLVESQDHRRVQARRGQGPARGAVRRRLRRQEQPWNE